MMIPEREEALRRLSGSNYGDMIYRLTKGDQVEYVAVSHDSCVVGVTDGIANTIKYGDNAYYWLASPADGIPEIAKLGWNGEKIR
jgi:hypothetical protein